MSMQVGHLERLVRQVDAGHPGALAGHRFGQDAAAAADVDDILASERDTRIDPFQPQWIDLMQGAEFGGRVPPAVGQFAEFLDFVRVGVACLCVHGRNDSGNWGRVGRATGKKRKQLCRATRK